MTIIELIKSISKLQINITKTKEIEIFLLNMIINESKNFETKIKKIKEICRFRTKFFKCARRTCDLNS